MLGVRIDEDSFNTLIVTGSDGNVLLAKGHPSHNPRILAGELWVAPGRLRAEQVKAIQRLDYPIPLFSRVLGNQRRNWQFAGWFQLGDIIDRPHEFPAEARARGNKVATVIRLRKVSQ